MTILVWQNYADLKGHGSRLKAVNLSSKLKGTEDTLASGTVSYSLINVNFVFLPVLIQETEIYIWPMINKLLKARKAHNYDRFNDDRNHLCQVDIN